MTCPRVSVVVPVRNRPDLLRLLLEALNRQTFRSFEIVIVDDGSTTPIGSAVAGVTPGLKIITRRTPGVGAVEARCVGASTANGEILAFTDSDCEPEPQWLENAVRAIDAGADLAQGVTRPARPPAFFERTMSFGGHEGLFATCNVVYRRDAFEAAGGFDRLAGSRFRFRSGRRAQGLGFGEDTLLGWRIAREGVVVVVPDAVVRHAVLRDEAREHLSRTWQIGAFPALVREVPELRRTLLRRRMFIGSASRVPLYIAALSVALGRHRLAAVAGATWIGRTYVALARRQQSRRATILILPLELFLDAVKAVALVTGSVRERTPVL